MTDDAAPDLDPQLLEILRCPACHGEFAPPTAEAMTCTACGLVYPVRGGVPILLVDEARPSR
jgi:uncharacterized protein